MDFTNLKNFMDYMAAEQNPGNAVVVFKDGRQVFRYAAGYSDLETKTPMTGEELFNIYSCSKITTVTAGVQLLERGKFLLNDPLYEYIPEFRDMYIKTEDGNLVKAQNPITIGDLFTMTAGFSYNFNAEGFKRARELTGGKMDTVETIRCIASDPIYFEPGTHWKYSICHDVLAAVISVISGQKFRDYVKENIFEPLDMTDSVYHHTEETLKRTASQYLFVPNSGEQLDVVEAQTSGKEKLGTFQKIDKINSHVLGEEYDSGGSGIITTLSDYEKLLAALANNGTGLTGEKILSKYAVDLMKINRLTPELKKDFSGKQFAGCGYGLGVRTHISPAESGVISNVGEFGWGGAAGATAIIDTQINLAVFLVQHTKNPREAFYQPRLRNVVYSCL
ncbi:MAG: beta-lactamase family protein [Lachnospiraceae bacterium]|nr:beta-lactamase family protein [Lachnospiraceae bacterium]